MLKYILLFPALVFEGPVATIVASFLASPGGDYVMNITIVAVLVFVADITGDSLYYLVGRYGKNFLISRYPKFISINPSRLITVERYFKRHGIKTVIFSKFSHGFGWMAMIGAGSTHMPFGKFISSSTFASVIKSSILVSAGYFYGLHHQSLLISVGRTGLIVTALFVTFIGYFVLRRK